MPEFFALPVAEDENFILWAIYFCPFTFMFDRERMFSRDVFPQDELLGRDVPDMLALRRRLLRPLFERYYSNFGRMILEEELLDESSSSDSYDSDEITGILNLDEISVLVRLENPGVDLGSFEEVEPEEMGFLEPYEPSIRAALLTLLLPNYASRGERYATHFRMWFIPIFRAELFAAMNEIRRSQYAAVELSQLRSIRSLTIEEVQAHNGDVHTFFEEYIRAWIRSHLVGLSEEQIDFLHTERWEGGSESICIICLEPFVLGDEITVLVCQHIFHSACIRPWLRLHNTCPTCRSLVLERDFDPDLLGYESESE